MAAGNPRPVLVVEDDPGLSKVIELVLQQGGYRTMSARDGREALVRVGEETPGAIVLDMRMPIMDGWEFAQAYRAQFGNTVPIIMLSAAPDVASRATEIKADAYLDKPFEIDELVAVIGRHYLETA